MSLSCTVWGNFETKGVYLFDKLLSPSDVPRIRGDLVAYNTADVDKTSPSAKSLLVALLDSHSIVQGQIDDGFDGLKIPPAAVKFTRLFERRQVAELDVRPKSGVSNRNCLTFEQEPL